MHIKEEITLEMFWQFSLNLILHLSLYFFSFAALEWNNRKRAKCHGKNEFFCFKNRRTKIYKKITPIHTQRLVVASFHCAVKKTNEGFKNCSNSVVISMS